MLIQLGWEKADIVAQSMGGHVAGLLTLDAPSKVGKLVLLNAGYCLALPEVADPLHLGHSQVAGGLKVLNPATRNEAAELLNMVFYDKKSFVTSEVIDAFFAQRLAVLDGWSIRSISESWARRENTIDDRLSGLGNHDVLVMQARHDEVAPLHLGIKIHEGIPGSKLIFWKIPAMPHLLRHQSCSTLNSSGF